MKSKKKRFSKIFSIIFSVLLLSVTITFLVLNFTGKKEEDSNTRLAFTSEDYQKLLENDVISDEKYFIFKNDDSSKTYEITGFNFDNTNGITESMLNDGLVIKFPESRTVTSGDITYTYTLNSINLTENLNVSAGSTTLNAYMAKVNRVKAVVIPKCVENITVGSFYGFGSLVYYEAPFIGSSRGSSAFGMDSSSTVESVPFVKMFTNPYESVNGYTESYLESGLRGFDIELDGNKYKLTTTIKNPITSAWYEHSSNNSKDYLIPGNLKKIVITDETKVGNRALFYLGGMTQATNGTITGLYGVEAIEITNNPSAAYTFGEAALAENYNMVEVKLPEDKVVLSTNLLNKDYSLTSVTLPKNITSLPSGSLGNCQSLKEVIMPSSIEEIASGAFTDDTLLEYIKLYSDDPSKVTDADVTLPLTLKTIQQDAFKNCASIKSITVPNSVTSIGYGAFSGCVSLNLISLPFVGANRGSTHNGCDSSTKDTHSLFGYIFGTSNIDGTYSVSQRYSASNQDLIATYGIPNKLVNIYITDDTEIGYGAFDGLSKVEKISLSDSITSMANDIFNDCYGLKELSIPFINQNLSLYFGKGTDQQYFDSASGYCVPTSLKNLIITNDAEIPSGVFYNLTYIESIVIGNATNTINQSIFQNNTSLKSLSLPFVGLQRGIFDPPSYWYWRDEAIRNSLLWLFSRTQTSGTYSNYAIGTSYWTEYVKYIPSSLEEITITDDTDISYYGFLRFKSLKKINIEKATTIGGGTMYGCQNLESLTLPFIGYNQNSKGDSGYQHVLGYIFGETSYTDSYAAGQYRTYYIPNSLKYVTISNSLTAIPAYAFANMQNIQTISSAGQIQTLNSYAFYNCKNLRTLNMPNASYKNVGAYAFYGDYNVMNIDAFIPSTVETIGSYAFAKTSIETIDLTKYKEIGSYAFSGCLQLQKIEIPAGVTISEGVFEGCQYLISVSLVQKVLTKNLFKNCTMLEGIDITGITVIPEGAFSGCTSLKSKDGTTGLIYDDQITKIGAYAFYNCKGLTSFILPSQLKTIESYAFSGCVNIPYMTILKEIETIKAHGWDNCDSNFYFYVYAKEKDWPGTWVDNWNCDYPVYVIGDEENTFIYEYSKDYKAYFIVGVVDNVDLTGIVNLPSKHLGLKVVGLKDGGTDTSVDSKNFLSNQKNVTGYVIPKTYVNISKNIFQTGNYIDLYFEAKESDINTLYKNGVDGWIISDRVEDAVSSNGNEILQTTFISKGHIFYGDSWVYGSDNSTPYLKLSSLTFNYEKTLTYDGERKTPGITSVAYPGYTLDGEDIKILDSINVDYLDMFDKVYKNNVSAGTATITISLNQKRYQEYLNSIDFYPVKLTGQATVNFTINKAMIHLYSNSSDLSALTYRETTYNGNEYSLSNWDNSNVSGLLTGAKFTGRLSTRGANAGTYKSSLLPNNTGDFYWSSDWKITRNGVDVSSNYQIISHLEVTINPREVAVDFTGGSYGSDNIYEYGYTGVEILPLGYAYDIETKATVKDCVVVGKKLGAIGNGVTPSTALYEAILYLNDNQNYKLMIYNASTGNYEAAVANLYTTTSGNITVKAYKSSFRIVNGKITITINLDYTIKPDEDYYEINLESGGTDSGIKKNAYVSGLGPYSVLEGKMKTSGDTATNYTYNATNGYSFDWDYNNISSPGYTITGKNSIDEMSYYDIEYNISVRINYAEFEITHYIDNVTQSKNELTLVNPTLTVSGDNRYILNITFPTEGDDYVYSVKPTNYVSYQGHPVTVSYFITENGGQTSITTAPHFTEVGKYRYGVALEGRHFISKVVIVDIDVVKSSYTLASSLDKEYDRQAYDVYQDQKLLKYERYDTATSNLSIKYYSDSRGENEISAPTEVGTYYLRITAEESKYFNSIDTGYKKFNITRRRIIFDITGSRVYDGNTILLTPTSQDLLSKGYLLGPVGSVTSADEFSGVLNTSSASPGIYNQNNVVWNPTWSVFNPEIGDVSNCYQIIINGEYEILYKEFNVTVTGYVGDYDATYHTGEIIVSNATDYVIYYSESPIDENTNLSRLTTTMQYRSQIGEYVIYFAIVKANYKTYYGSYKITINPMEIEYFEYDGQTNQNHTYRVYYTGAYIRYELDIRSPWNAIAYYSYNGSAYTYDAFEFKELGEYVIKYYIEAENYKTEEGTIIFIIEDETATLPSDYKVVGYTGVYDGLYHSASVTLPSNAPQNSNVYYSLDGKSWSKTNFEFKEVGKTLVYVRLIIPGYRRQDYTVYVEITGMALEDISLKNYKGVYDGKYHTVTLSGSHITSTQNDDGTYTYYYDGNLLTVTYTSNRNNVDAKQGYVSNVSYKDTGVYYIWVMITGENYETIYLGDGVNQGVVEITHLDNPTGRIPYQEFEYSTYTNSKLQIESAHDGAKAYYYYLATYDALNDTYSCDFSQKTTVPEELGYYYVRVEFLASKNAAKMVLSPLESMYSNYLSDSLNGDNFIRIVPKTVKVMWDEEFLYDGETHSPNPVGVTGTSDEIYIAYSLINPIGVDPILPGEYTFSVSMVGNNPNYVLDRSEIVMRIVKQVLEIKIEEEMEASKDSTGAYTPWEKNDGWDLLGLPLLVGHHIEGRMYTERGEVAIYYYLTGAGKYDFNNWVIVDSFKVIDTDGNDVSSFYDITISAVVKIRNPYLNLGDLEDTIISYDGLGHIPNFNLKGLEGSRITYLDDEGNQLTSPDIYYYAGTYEYNILVTKAGYEPTKALVKLIINKVDLNITINPIDDPLDSTDDLYKIYSDSDKDLTYNVLNVSDRMGNSYKANGNETHIKYYPKDLVTYDEVLSLYKNYSDSSKTASLGLDHMHDAGVYFAVVYFEDTLNKWNMSYQILETEVLRRDIDVDLPAAINMHPDYNGSKVVISLNGATFDKTMLVSTHRIDDTKASSFSARTNSANAGVYNPATDFEFSTMAILDSNGLNVSKNYRPVLSSNVYVKIEKTYLTSDTFNVEDFTKEYDGLVNLPKIDTDSDGLRHYKFYKYENGSLTDTPKYICDGTSEDGIGPTEVGLYYVEIYIDEGTNYYASNVARPGGVAVGTLSGNVEVRKKEVNVIFENSEITFNGTKMAPRAYFIDVFGNEHNLLSFFIEKDGSETTYKTNAGSYEVYARFNDSDSDEANYDLKNAMSNFVINKASYEINIGSIRADNSSTKYRVNLDKGMISDFPDSLTISYAETAAAYLLTISSDPGLYKGNDSFEFYITTYLDGIDVSDSVEYSVIGQVLILSSNIIYNSKDVKVTYADGAEYSISNLGALVVTVPTTGYRISYRIEGEDRFSDIEPKFSDAGEYVVEYRIEATGYEAVNGFLTITILKKQSYITFTKSLNKVYDGSSYDISTLIASNAHYGFNGTTSSLIYDYYELSNGSWTLLPSLSSGGTEKPINAGTYKVKITSATDFLDGVVLNYTPLEQEFTFVISPKDLSFTINKDQTVTSSDLSKQFTFGETNVEATFIPDLRSGDRLTYEVSNDNIQRNTFTYKGRLDYNEVGNNRSSNQFNATTLKTNIGSSAFTITWYISRVNSDDPSIIEYISSNYTVNLDFTLYIHYTLMKIEISGGEFDFDGNSHSGTLNILNPTSVDSMYFSSKRAIDPNNSETLLNTVSSISDSSVSFTNPGTYTVYYLLTAANYEEFFGQFTIKIKYIDRDISFTDLMSKTYDGNPMFAKNYGNSNYLPNYTNNLDGNTIGTKTYPKDDVDKTKIEIKYNVVGSTAKIDSTVGAINAGSYHFVMTIPQSTYYSETVIEGDFLISKRILMVTDRDTLSFVYNGVSKNYDMSQNTNYDIYYLEDNGGSHITNDFTIKGDIITTNASVGVYNGKNGTLIWYNGFKAIKDGQDVSTNYSVRLDEASITITPADMELTVKDTYNFDYDGKGHSIKNEIILTRPSSVNASYLKDGNYVSGYESFISADTYKTTIRLTATNYNNFEKEVTIVIGKGKPNMKIETSLSQEYNGKEVVIPEKITTHPEGLSYIDYTYEYYEYVEGSYKAFSVLIWDKTQNRFVATSSTGSLSRPVNVGQYKVVVKIPATENYQGLSIEQDFTISQKKIKATWDTTSFTYNGTPQAPKATFNLADDGSNFQVGYTITGNDPNHENVGIYQITVGIVSQSISNYVIDESSKTTSYSIIKRNVTVSLNANRSYGAQTDYIFTFNASNPGLTEYTILNLVSGHSSNTRLKCKYNTVGIYSNISNFSFEGTSNMFEIVDSTLANVTANYNISYTINLVINYGNIEYSATPVEVTYDGNYYGINVIVNTLGNFSVKYSLTGGSNPTDYTLEESPKFKDVRYNKLQGKVEPYMVYFVIVDEDSNPQNSPIYGSTTVTIKPASANLALKDPNSNPNLDKIYDGTAVVDPDVTYNSEVKDTPIFTYYKRVLDSTGNYTFQKLDKAPYLAGNYKLEITLSNSGDYNYSKASLTYEFTISKRVLTIAISRVTKYFDYEVYRIDLTKIGVNNLALHDILVRGVLKTASADVGVYDSENLFVFENGLYISNEDTNDDRTSNYEIAYSVYVEIINAPIEAEIIPYIGTYDGAPHTISYNVKESVTLDNGVIIKGPKEPTVRYSSTRNGNYTTDIITRTNVGVTTVYVLIEAPNFEPFYGEATITIEGKKIPGKDDSGTGGGSSGGDDSGKDDKDPPVRDPNDPDYDPDDKRNDPDYHEPEDSPYLHWVKNFVYNGQNYPTPYYVSDSKGAQTVRYYTVSDFNSGKTNPMTEVVNVGDYVMVIDVATDGEYEAFTVTQQFGIYKKAVNVTWENLTYKFGTAFTNVSSRSTMIQSNRLAYYLDINSNKVYATVDLSEILDLNSIILAGSYSISAKTSDNNYLLKDETATLTIEKALVKEPNIRTDLTFEFLEDIIISDVDGNMYYLDNDGNILKIVHSDGSEEENPSLLYKFIIDEDKNADGVIKTQHKLKIVFKDYDEFGYIVKDNYEWEVRGDSNNIEIYYEITPLDLRTTRSDYKLKIRYTPSVVWDDSYKPAYEPELTITVQIVETGDEITLNLGSTNVIADYIASYQNNTGVPADGSKSVIEIEGINNYLFNEIKYFTILAKAPDVLTLSDSATVAFITADYDKENQKATIIEDLKANDVEDRTYETKTKHNYYLGHLYQGTTIQAVLDQFINEQSKIKVFDYNNQPIDVSDYDSKTIGTNFRIVLYKDELKKDGEELDEITTILFGDLSGLGTINLGDLNKILMIINGSLDFDSAGDAFYFAGCIASADKTSSIGLASYNDLLMHLNSAKDINSDYYLES